STLSSGSTRIAACSWEAMTDGTLQQNYTITAVATANGGTLTSNDMSQVLTVNDNRADIGIVDIELANNITDFTGNTDFSLNVTVANNGYLDAEDFVIEVYASVDSWTATQDNWFSGNENYTERIGNITVALLAGGSEITREVECTGVPTGDYEIFVVIDSDLNNTDAIAYDGFTPIYGSVEEYDETNNNRTVSGTAVMPALMARIQLPEPGIIDGKWTNVYIDGETSSVEIRGNIVRVDKPTVGVPGVEVTVSVDGGESYTVTTGQAGAFTVAIPITATGNYTVTVSGDGIASDTTWFRVDTASVFPFWILILIVVIVVVIIVGITLYLYFVGLGKTVQCGECGAFIPEGAAKCPKCGVEFETEVAKCSVCGAWVPIDVKNCPECGTEFTVGTEDLDDYEAKMKRQYDDVVRKFREQAKTEIGKEFTETEFQAWWASKPTFITFDQWLKEEEEMKRMGSRPCPVCQMENSVTAKICHKCGSVMGDAKAPAPKKPEGKMPPAEKKPAAAPAPAPQKQQPPAQQPQAAPQQHAAAPQPAPAQAAAPQTQQPAGTPGKKGCPSCGMEVNAGEKICPICNYDFGDQSGAQATRIVRKPIKKIVRRPGEPGGDQQQQQ
ncbi:MAG: CARDB domain-containing protein, partial [Thermoplasmata archaeon]|nr:CARDB domain-containing protein [Thermoplasmata archaeon]